MDLSNPRGGCASKYLRMSIAVPGKRTSRGSGQAPKVLFECECEVCDVPRGYFWVGRCAISDTVQGRGALFQQHADGSARPTSRAVACGSLPGRGAMGA